MIRIFAPARSDINIKDKTQEGKFLFDLGKFIGRKWKFRKE